MSKIPPKYPNASTENDAEPAGNLPVMYPSQESSSFPVLEAFQKFIEQERAQSRKRMLQLSMTFSMLLLAVIAIFIAIGFFMMNNMSGMQSKLLEAALKKDTPPQQTLSLPANNSTAETLARTLQDAFQQMLKSVGPSPKETIVQRTQEKTVADDLVQKQSQNLAMLHAELAKVRQESQSLRERMGEMKKESDTLKVKMGKIREQTRKEVVNEMRNRAPIQIITRGPAPSVQQTPAVKSVPQKVSPEAKVVKAPPLPAISPTKEKNSVAKADKGAPLVIAPVYPKATKEPPVPGKGIKRPDPPKGMISAALPLKGKKSGTVPWRALIPE